MIKYLFIVINSLAVFLYSLFSGDSGVTVTGTFPATIKAGQEAAIEIKITKGAMNGFAKLQMELPEGLAPKESENKGANYTYSGGVAKWVWASLPPENEIIIKIKLISSEEASGPKLINAKFSFVENNAKQVVEMTPAEINIVTGDAAAANTAAPATTETPAATAVTTTENTTNNNASNAAENNAGNNTTTAPVTTETPAAAQQNAVITETPVATTPPAAAQGNSNAEPPGNINVVRTITKVSDTEFLVNLKIKKGATKGFARYSDDLPDALTVKAIKTDGSSFSTGDGKLKFVWVTVPAKDQLELEYSLTGNLTGQIATYGEYSYLEDNQSKKYKLPVENMAFSGQGQLPDAEPAKAATETNAANASTNAADNSMNETLAKKEGNVNYHVQIGAFTNSKVDAGRLKKVFNVTETISSEMQGGFSKFMVGSHGEYKDARDHRETMKGTNGIKSAFVVAYNGSKRITVQEALMISNQKWFK